ncbi:MAG: glycosyltransferase family 61 protein [Magnetococcales bacterium]|nr:glycosyltransferase family 61 protein [Magnetococcales bacterium]
MYLELPSLLRRSFAAADEPGQPLFAQFAGYVDKILSMTATGAPSDLDEMAARLLWIAAHYISACAASHGLQLGYVARETGEDLPASAPAGGWLESLPTSVVLHTLYLTGTQVRAHACAGGGQRTPFEAEDLAHFCGKSGREERFACLVIRQEAPDAAYAAQLERLIAAQPLIAYVLVVRPTAQPRLDCPTLAAGAWEMSHLPCAAVALDIYRNTRWDQQLSHQPALDIAPSVQPRDVQPRETAPSEKWLPMVAAELFGGVSRLEQLPSEVLAGAEINFYSVEENGTYSRKTGRFTPITTQERTLYECLDVNVSQTGILWRDGRVLFDPFYAHFTDLKKLDLQRGEAMVSEPTHHVQGCCFLSVTSNTHHSHLIFETLRKLHFAERYQPDIQLLASSTLSPSQRDYFAPFGFPPERCLYKHPDATWRVERLIFSSEAPMSYDRVSMDYLRRFGVAHYPGQQQGPQRIYISRRDSRVYRNLVNEEEIEKIFEWFGFSVILASTLSPQEKMRLFASARYVAGPLGAAFSYMPFSLDGATIMLTSHAYFPVEFQEMASIRLKRLNVIFGISLQMFSPVWQYGHNSFYLPPDLVVSALGEILHAA